MNKKTLVFGVLAIFTFVTTSAKSTTLIKLKMEKQNEMEKQFTAKKKSWSIVLHAEASAEETFSLLCPVREYDWIPNWSCEMVFSESGIAEDMCVFKTKFNPDEGEETWICTHYEKNSYIEYLHYLPNRITRLRIILIDDKPAGSDWKWEQDMVGLNESGNQFIESYEKSGAFLSWINRLTEELNYYLRHNEKINWNRN